MVGRVVSDWVGDCTLISYQANSVDNHGGHRASSSGAVGDVSCADESIEGGEVG